MKKEKNNMLLEEKVDNINKRIRSLKEKRCIIFGAGQHTEKLLCYTELSMYSISGIVDKQRKTPMGGLVVLSPKSVDWTDVDAVVVSSCKYQDEIKQELIAEYHFEGEIVLLYDQNEKVPFYKLQSKENAIIWKGDFENWSSACEECARSGFSKVYEDDTILSHNIESLESVKKNVSYGKYYHLIAWLLRIAGENKNRLRVLDLGGALGNIYYSIKDFFCTLEEFEWIIVEQPHFVSYGKKHLEEQSLKFCGSIDEAYKYANGNIDVALGSAVLSYLPSYNDYLQKFIDLCIPNIIIDRQLLGEKERITMQDITDKYPYQAAYPCRILQKSIFLAFFKESYKCMDERTSSHEGPLVFHDQIAEFYFYVFRCVKN